MSGVIATPSGVDPREEREHHLEHDEVRERDADVEQHDARDQQRHREALLALVEARRDELPHLEQHDRHRDEQRDEERRLERREERRRDLRDDQLQPRAATSRSGSETYSNTRWRERREPEQHDDDREHRLHEPRAQLEKVRHERAFRELLPRARGCRAAAHYEARRLVGRL